ncbi:hypothetical protein PPYR_11230 [Photinus pyralis]|uniref:Uncharacterized protein n=1 Tax=Photinus pyralis TaxID=7054 RepID=A0A1Y1L6T7_PHOPY|nr:uncharacterized protein LOC116175742 [Photinus pyralis]KAB0794391.1 hypothetical protein PPYR_11230 [Photinus pyralis]
MCLKLTIQLALAIFFIAGANAAPYKSRHEPASAKNCSDSESDESAPLIDQTQKGKENYRINVKDFVLVWAPSDILLTAAALFDSQILGGELFGSDSNEEIEDALLENKPSQNSSAIVDSNGGDKVTINSAQKSKRSKFRFPALVNTGKKS